MKLQANIRLGELQRLASACLNSELRSLKLLPTGTCMLKQMAALEPVITSFSRKQLYKMLSTNDLTDLVKAAKALIEIKPQIAGA